MSEYSDDTTQELMESWDEFMRGERVTALTVVDDLPPPEVENNED